MKKIQNQIRQGDVLLVPIGIVPSNAKSLLHKKITVLAEGEATGHAHTISSAPEQMKLYEVETELYLEVLQPVTLSHQEHGEAVLEPEVYLVRRQVETWMDEVRQVAD